VSNLAVVPFELVSNLDPRPAEMQLLKGETNQGDNFMVTFAGVPGEMVAHLYFDMPGTSMKIDVIEMIPQLYRSLHADPGDVWSPFERETDMDRELPMEGPLLGGPGMSRGYINSIYNAWVHQTETHTIIDFARRDAQPLVIQADVLRIAEDLADPTDEEPRIDIVHGAEHPGGEMRLILDRRGNFS